MLLPSVIDCPTEMFRFPVVPPLTAPPAVKMAQQAPSVEGISFKQMMMEAEAPEELSTQTKKEMMLDQIDDEMPEPEEIDTEKLLEAEAKDARKDAEPEKRSLADLLVETDLADQSLVSRSVDRDMDQIVRRSSPEGPSAGEDIWGPSAAGAFQTGTGEIASLEGNTQVAGYEDIGKHLEVALQTYTAPASGEKYFKLLIRVKQGRPTRSH